MAIEERNGSYFEVMSYVVETEQHQKILEHDEIEVYGVEEIRLEVEGEEVDGRCFVWISDPAELVDSA